MSAQAPRLPFSLHPLIAEAKRRAKRRRVLLAGVVALVLSAGSIGLVTEWSSRGPARALPASLLITGEDQFGHTARWNLNCVPASGDVHDPAAVCEAIAAQPSLVTNPLPDGTCSVGHGWLFTIYGRVDNSWVNRTVSSLGCSEGGFMSKLGLVPRLRSLTRS